MDVIERQRPNRRSFRAIRREEEDKEDDGWRMTSIDRLVARAKVMLRSVPGLLATLIFIGTIPANAAGRIVDSSNRPGGGRWRYRHSDPGFWPIDCVSSSLNASSSRISVEAAVRSGLVTSRNRNLTETHSYSPPQGMQPCPPHTSPGRMIQSPILRRSHWSPSFRSWLSSGPDIPANTVPEFIALLESSPDNTALTLVASVDHLTCSQLFKFMAGCDGPRPFRGDAQSSAALLGGQIDFVIDGLAPQLGNIADNRVRVLGVTTPKRIPFLPDAPAFAEFLPGHQYPMWVAVFAPSKTSSAIVNSMSSEIQKAMPANS